MLSKFDKELVKLLYNEFPLHPQPFAIIADRLGLSVAEVLDRTKSLIERGVVKRVGIIPDHSKMGFRFSSLIGAQIPQERIKQVTEFLRGKSYISLAYLTSGEYNLWLRAIASTEEELKTFVQEVVSGLKANKVLELRTERIIKLHGPYRI